MKMGMQFISHNRTWTCTQIPALIFDDVQAKNYSRFVDSGGYIKAIMSELHPRLAADTLPLATWELSQVRLMNDANYPWLILVPARKNVTGLHQLSPQDGAALMSEINRASMALEQLYTPSRINVAALGNMVSQLHIHVIARFENDAAWPGPVWGAVPTKDYGDEDLRQTVEKFVRAF